MALARVVGGGFLGGSLLAIGFGVEAGGADLADAPPSVTLGPWKGQQELRLLFAEETLTEFMTSQTSHDLSNLSESPWNFSFSL